MPLPFLTPPLSHSSPFSGSPAPPTAPTPQKEPSWFSPSLFLRDFEKQRQTVDVWNRRLKLVCVQGGGGPADGRPAIPSITDPPTHRKTFPTSPSLRSSPRSPSTLCCLYPCFHSDTFPTQAHRNRVHGLRVGVGWGLVAAGGGAGSSEEPDYFQKADRGEKKLPRSAGRRLIQRLR